MNSRVDILLATYQGSLFLDAQLKSIFEQSYCNFHLYIRDDHSTDGTQMILERWKAIYPQKITLLPSSENLGIKKNFSSLMEASQAPYAMFCDQDDVWLPDKIEVTLKKMEEQELLYGKETPLLVHTDLCVVNQNLEKIDASFFSYCHLDPTKRDPQRLLLQNIVTGCTVMVNRALLKLSSPIPLDAIMHDWWIALVASFFGKMAFIPQSTILYRQHGRNDTGAKKYSFFRLFFTYFQIILKKRKKVDYLKQATVFHFQFKNQLFKKQKEKKMLKALIDLKNSSFLEQKKTIFQYGFFKQGFLRNLEVFILGL